PMKRNLPKISLFRKFFHYVFYRRNVDKTFITNPLILGIVAIRLLCIDDNVSSYKYDPLPNLTNFTQRDLKYSGKKINFLFYNKRTILPRIIAFLQCYMKTIRDQNKPLEHLMWNFQ